MISIAPSLLISPLDLGARGVYGVKRPCVVQRRCGRSFEAFGFAPCSVAGTLGRLLGINPYSEDVALRGREEICRHCIYSVSPALQKIVRQAARREELPHPTKTFAGRLDKYIRVPNTYPRWNG